MPSIDRPQHTQVLVVGGGPAGSYAAAALAREGFKVVLMESSKFPRYHIGESLIPSVRHYLRFIDADEKVANYGFATKPGSAIKFNQYKKEGYTDFMAIGHDNNAWNVVRSEFDQLLLQHAASLGVRVFECTQVTSLSFAPRASSKGSYSQEDDSCGLGRPVSATYVTTSPCASSSCSSSCSGDHEYIPAPRTITFDYLVDATGRAGLMCTKYLKNRRVNETLKNVAVWGYWRDTGIYSPGTARENAPWFEALIDQSGWAWFIPLQNGLTSVGIVVDEKILSTRSRSASVVTPPPTPTMTTSPKCPARPGLASRRTGRSSTISFPSFSIPFSFPLSSSPAPASVSPPPKSPLLPPVPLSSLPPSAPVAASPPSGSALLSPIFCPPSPRQQTLADKYLAALKLAPGVIKLLGKGTLISGSVGEGSKETWEDSAYDRERESVIWESVAGMARGGVKSASDFSYSAKCYAGEGFRVVGDAAAFIDPFFSSGVHLAFTGGLSAATTIAASIRGNCTEEQAAEWHTERVGTSYTRFLIVVLSAYKQIRAQSTDVLADVDEDNFDRAFAFLRPVIQGASDIGPHLSPTELQRALDFCVNLFSPTTPEQHARVSSLLAASSSGSGILDVTKPVLDPQALDKIVEGLAFDAESIIDPDLTSGSQDAREDQDGARVVKMVLDKVNARRVIHPEHSGISTFEEESLGGFVARLVKGQLGLVRISEPTRQTGPNI